MKYKFNATYEFEAEKPEMVHGETAQSQHHLAAREACRLLKKTFPRRKPTSIVVVLELERGA